MSINYRLPPKRENKVVETSEDVGTPGSPYPASYVEPPNSYPFASASQIAYRGAMAHGVPTGSFDTIGSIDAPNEVQESGESEKATAMFWPDIEEPVDLKPIPVKIVETVTPVGVRNLFSVQTIPLLAGQTGGQRVLGYRQNRTLAKITIKRLLGSAAGPDRVYVSNSEQPDIMNGYPVDTGDTFTTNTTEDVWVTIDPASNVNGALLVIYTEFEITAFGEKNTK